MYGPGLRSVSLPTAAAPGWWQDRVFYEIFVRSFADATTGPLANDGVGDFQGLVIGPRQPCRVRYRRRVK